MTDNPSEASDVTEGVTLESFATALAATVGAESWSVEAGSVRIEIGRDRWTESLAKAGDEGGLPFFSWLSAVDWSKEVAVGEGVDDPDGLVERYEVICRLSSVENANGAQFVATLPKDDAVIDSLVDIFGGAEWHERETHEMFGIEFRGHPRLVKLYLPDAFEGHPLRKSFPLLSREVKPWPGMVDVEDMPSDGPSTENVEAAALDANTVDDGADSDDEGAE